MNQYLHISQIVGIANETIRKVKEGDMVSLRTSSLKEQEKIGGYFPSDQVTIAARSGMGKTARVIQDIQDFCNKELNPEFADNIIVLFDTWEMAAWRNVMRMYSKGLSKPVSSLLSSMDKIDDETFEHVIALSKELAHYPVWFNQISQSWKSWYANKESIIKKNPGKQFVNVIDHTRLVTRTTERTEEELITNFVKSGMALKNSYGTINIFLSQLNRNIETNAKSREMIGKHLPVASDIFGSDAVMQCSDIVLTLHRPGAYGLETFQGMPTGYDKNNPDSEDNLMILGVLKQREGWTGNIAQYHELKNNLICDYTNTRGQQRA